MRSRRRSTALRDTAGVYHVASRLAYEGFHATVASRGAGTGTDVLAGLPDASGTVPIAVRTTVCPPQGDCEWRIGKGDTLVDDPGVELKRAWKGCSANFCFRGF